MKGEEIGRRKDERMTIGIAACGPNAGRAVHDALMAAQSVASGSIGGFAVFAAISENGELLRAHTQRGGAAMLFLDGERCGALPPPDIAAAPLAAVISSGPDRPAPLEPWLAADPRVGLVTGHRVPLELGPDGKAYNLAALERMALGFEPQEAVDAVTGADPEGDVGLIAVDRLGHIGLSNSQRVARRPDLGWAQSSLQNGARVAVLHNAIRPLSTLAPLVADVALEVMGARPLPKGSLRARVGTTVAIDATDAVDVDGSGTVIRILTSNERTAVGRYVGGVIALGAEVRRDGEIIGHTLSEPNVLTDEGCVTLLNGSEECLILFG